MVQWLIQMVVEIPQHSLELLLQELAGYFHRRRYTGALADGRLSPSAHLSKVYVLDVGNRRFRCPRQQYLVGTSGAWGK